MGAAVAAAFSGGRVAWANADGFARYVFARDPKFDPFTFSNDKYAARIRDTSELYDATNPDLSPFLARGGKLIIKGNGADYQRSMRDER